MLTSGSGFTAYRTYTFGAGTDVPVPGDYDRDGRADIAMWRPSTGVWTVLQSIERVYGDVDVQLGGGERRAGAGRLRRGWADGSCGVAAVDRDLVRGEVDGRVADVSVWGVGTDRPVPADYDGDRQNGHRGVSAVDGGAGMC